MEYISVKHSWNSRLLKPAIPNPNSHFNSIYTEHESKTQQKSNLNPQQADTINSSSQSENGELADRFQVITDTASQELIGKDVIVSIDEDNFYLHWYGISNKKVQLTTSVSSSINTTNVNNNAADASNTLNSVFNNNILKFWKVSSNTFFGWRNIFLVL